MTREPIVFTLAHSPDPDDVFMWWPITGMVEALPPGSPSDTKGCGENRAGRVLRAPSIDTGPFTFQAVAADIQSLNRHAAGPDESALYDVTALSFYAWAMVRDRYAPCRTGSSFGEGYGPKIIARAPTGASASAIRAHSARSPAPLVRTPSLSLDHLRSASALRIAVPGLRTTARLVFEMCVAHPRERAGLAPHALIEMGFEHVIPSVASGECDAGIVIHQGQIQFTGRGLVQVVDLGAWWKLETGLALPLGANAIRTDLDRRFGPGTVAEVSRLLRASLEHALAHRDEAVAYARTFAAEISDEETRRYLDMYVTNLTLDAGPAGEHALRELLARAQRLGLLASTSPPDDVRMV